MTGALKSADIVAALRRRYGTERDSLAPEWALLTELSSRVGYANARADIFVIRAWSGGPKRHERHLIEVKVSRSDLRNELAKPEKIMAIGRFAHRIYFATPPGLVRADEDLGAGVGLLEVHPGGVREVRKAKRRDPEPMPEELQVEVFRRAGRAEGRIAASGSGDDLAAKVVSLEKHVASAARTMYTAQEASRRNKRRLDNFLQLLAQAGGAPCKCGQASLEAQRSGTWTHSHSDGTECLTRWPEPDLVALADVLLGDDGYQERLEQLARASRAA